MNTKAKQTINHFLNHNYLQIFSGVVIVFFFILKINNMVNMETLLIVIFLLVALVGLESIQKKPMSVNLKLLYLILMLVSLVLAILITI